jgi:hypothetical protein
MTACPHGQRASNLEPQTFWTVIWIVTPQFGQRQSPRKRFPAHPGTRTSISVSVILPPAPGYTAPSTGLASPFYHGPVHKRQPDRRNKNQRLSKVHTRDKDETQNHT